MKKTLTQILERESGSSTVKITTLPSILQETLLPRLKIEITASSPVPRNYLGTPEKLPQVEQLSGDQYHLVPPLTSQKVGENGSFKILGNSGSSQGSWTKKRRVGNER